MGRSSRMKPEEVRVVRHQNAPRRSREFELSGVIGAGQSRLRSGGYVDVAAAKTGGDAGGDMFVQMEADGHRLGRFFQPRLAQLGLDQRWVIAAELLHKLALSPHLFPYFRHVIEVVGERGVNVGERERWNLRNDIVGSHPLVLMPGHDVEHTDTVTRDAGSAAAYARRLRDPVPGRRLHDSSISRGGRSFSVGSAV